MYLHYGIIYFLETLTNVESFFFVTIMLGH